MTEQGKHWRKGLNMTGVATRLGKIRDILIQLRDLQEKDGNKKIKDIERALAAKSIIATASARSAGRS